jgi:nitronate monooxygenase
MVVEGPKAGGHIGFKTEQINDPNFALDRLVPEVINALEPYETKYCRKIPIIAAGGVYSGGDIQHYMNLGATGVQMGTRFVTTHECDADNAFKQAYLNAKAEDMVVINSPVGLPGRVIRNDFTDAVNRGEKKPFSCPFHCIKTCDARKSPYCISLALGNACKGKLKHGFAFAGINAHRIEKIVSVRELMASLVQEVNPLAA